MATHDYDIANQSGANFRADLNNCLDAIVSNNSSGSEPATKFAYMWWVDTSNDILKIRNSANNAWIDLPMSITTSNTISPTLNMGTGAAEDVKIVFDGNAQDFYIALDDSADDLLIGKGSTVGTTPAIAIDENLLTTLHGGLTMVGTTPTITIGDGGEEDTKIVFDGNAQDFYIGLDDSADDLIIGKGSAVGTTPAIVIDENLKVGINEDAPTQNLSVGLTAGALSGIGLTLNDTDVAGFLTNSSTGEVRFGGVFANFFPTFYSNNSEVARFTTTGNFGVGTTSPAAHMHLESTGATQLRIRTTSSSSEPQILMFDGAGDYFAFQKVDRGMTFKPQGAEAARVDNSGNLLLGTTSAEQDSGAGVKLKDDGNGRCYLVGASDSGEGFSMHNGSVFRFFVGYNGTVNATTASISAISDERLKENIRPLDKGLEDILKLKPRLFDWKKGEGSDKKNVSGFIAQEAEEAGFEEFIGGWKHEELPDAKSFAQGGLIPALVKSIQQQQEQIKLLEQKIEVLENGD